MTSILVVEDDEAIRAAVARGLRERGYAVSTVGSGLAGVEQVVQDAPDAVLLDLGLPDVDGLTLISMLRAVSQVPIIVITAQDDDPTMVRGPRQRRRRLRGQALRHRAGGGPGARRAAPWRARRGAGAPSRRELVIDERTRVVSLSGAASSWPARSSSVLHLLATRQGSVVSKRELLAEVWQQPYGGSDRTVDVHLSWLRRKLGETAAEPRYLLTVRGVGVRLVDPDAPRIREPG